MHIHTYKFLEHLVMLLEHFRRLQLALGYQLIVKLGGGNTQTHRIILTISLVLVYTVDNSQAMQMVGNMLLYDRRILSGASDSLCSFWAVFKMIRNLTYRIFKFNRSWALCTYLQKDYTIYSDLRLMLSRSLARNTAPFWCTIFTVFGYLGFPIAPK